MPRRRTRNTSEFSERMHAFKRAVIARAGGLSLVALGGWIILALSSFSISDASINTSSFRVSDNWMGGLGASFADLFLQVFGGAAFLFAPPMLIWGSLALGKSQIDHDDESSKQLWIRLGLFVVSLILLSTAMSGLPTPATWPFVVGVGGLIGGGISGVIEGLALQAGLDASVISLFVTLVFLVGGIVAYAVSCGLNAERSEAAVIEAEYYVAVVVDYVQSHIEALRGEDVEEDIGDLSKSEEAFEEEYLEDDEEDYEEPPLVAEPRRKIIRKHGKKKASKREAREMQPELPVFSASDYELPPLNLLGKPKAKGPAVISDEALEQNARMLENVLSDFGVRGEIINVRPGPVVTLYELEPAAGVKSSRVIGLADDIARSMSAVAARVAVVPGRNAIGIELPNQDRETVFIRELLGAADYENTRGDLTLALGKSIGGEPSFADLARMPHLLIAGTTGSGKSVGINTMILSLLYRLSPEHCKLIMIDPKMLELSVYEGIPHLLAPVVTDPRKAVVALKWTVREMEERYKRMSKVGVRNVEGFNQRVLEAEEAGEMLTRTVHTGYDEESGEPIYETEELDYKPMPFIVVVIDEVADLMMVAGKDIEGMVQRLAQMARAAGIHLIMATQRPSVDVITGTIKANFPTRISFQVTSKIDSRTILGEQGAEQLLGMGDMLFMAGGGRVRRVHGAFVSDDEVEKVVKFLKKQGKPEYVQEVTEMREDEDGAVAGLDIGGNTNSGDALYDKAVAIVLRDRKASTSYVQRRLQIGYNRAATLIERMEEDGVISAANHAGKREILVGEDAA